MMNPRHGNRPGGALLVFALMCMLLATGCTRNNGDIGKWFGTWHLTEITADGRPEADYDGNIFWKFQNDIISMVRVNTAPAMNTRDQVWGTWSEGDGTLSLRFDYSDNANSVENAADGKGIYVPFAETHIPYGGVTMLRIEQQKGDAVRLSYTGEDGTEYGYFLKKQ